jgi:hypothetical protein
MLQKLKLKAESFDSWVTKVKEAMDPKNDKIELSELKELLNEAENKKFPESELLTALTTAVQDAEKCASVAQQLLNNKQRTRLVKCKILFSKILDIYMSNFLFLFYIILCCIGPGIQLTQNINLLLKN